MYVLCVKRNKLQLNLLVTLWQDELGNREQIIPVLMTFSILLGHHRYVNMLALHASEHWSSAATLYGTQQQLRPQVNAPVSLLLASSLFYFSLLVPQTHWSNHTPLSPSLATCLHTQSSSCSSGLVTSSLYLWSIGAYCLVRMGGSLVSMVYRSL
jgi:hypothetical protein